MRINFKYGAAVGILAAAFGMLGPMAVQAGQAPGTSVPAGVGAASVPAPATHLNGIGGRPVVLTSMIERPAWQHGFGIAQRENIAQRGNFAQREDMAQRGNFAQREIKGLGNGRELLGLRGLQDRNLLQGNGCGYCDGCGYGHCDGCHFGGCGYGHFYGCHYDWCGYRHFDGCHVDGCFDR